MAAVLPTVRQPFGELSNSRVQQLSSAKNRQNGLISNGSPLSGKPMSALSKTPKKRAYSPSPYDEADAENVDPGLLSPSKKSKGDDCSTPVKPFAFVLKPTTSMLPPPARLATPLRASMPSPRAPLTAPAGRSPKRKMATNRRISAPFTRIDPPSGTTGASTLPFSLDAALKGTLPTSTLTAPELGATIEESKRSDLFFEIYEDTPEEEAAILMEHSTLTLDLSSDDEAKQAARSDRGKENTPPEGYDAPIASRAVAASVAEALLPAPTRVKKADIVRRKIVEMDDGERTPLSDLETEPFLPEGLEKDSHVVVDAVVEQTKLKVEDLFAVKPKTFTAGVKKRSRLSTSSLLPSPKKTGLEAEEPIAIFEDSEDVLTTRSPACDAATMSKKDIEVASDENAAPALDAIV
ncbi:hypothetical protein B0A48_00501 [Cryoendolithus antarcticus]|uniref:Uncharacterized protein n=1 Tax=Cryoendolithus antarcticus TaxID=1507870 RepID=A0A1V8TUU8_9PEZI|nr:hypothetical protein B0A48_00501 [Cryoendolithus antarcticus]